MGQRESGLVGKLRLIGLLALLVSASCSAADPEASGASDVESILFNATGGSSYVMELNELITGCARWNGLDGYIHQEQMPSPINVGGDLEGRDFAVEFGTGGVALEAEIQKGPPADMVPIQPDPASEAILELGPVSTPDGGQYQGGCRQWAEQELTGSEKVAAATEVATAYQSRMQTEYFESPEYLALEDEWVACMNEAGFDSIRSRDEADELIAAEIDRWLDGKETYDEALAFDRLIGLAWWDCQAAIEERNDQLADSVASRFADENQQILDQLAD